MRVSIVSRHLPLLEGSAAGRILHATRDGLRELGHDVSIWSWGPEPPAGDLPDGCEWHPLVPESSLKSRTLSLVRPRDETARTTWNARPDAVAVADDFLSFGAVRDHACSVVTIHYLTALDSRALGRYRPRDMQSWRAERRAVRKAHLVLTYSPRIVDALGRGEYVPAAIPIPEDPLPFVAEPVAALIADWRWPPNRWAGEWLLARWRDVVDEVPDARLVLGGRGTAEVLGDPDLPGVDVVGPVEHSRDVLERAAVLAFPCPPTTGPKVKVLESMAAGLPVVTTSPGVEGIERSARQHAVISDLDGFADALAKTLEDADRRRALASQSRAAVIATHGPTAAAAARATAFEQAFGR